MTINSLFDPKLLQKDFQSDITAYYFVEWEDFNMNSQHSHDRVEIMYVINGKCRVDVENKTSNLNKGDFILIDAGIPHALIVEKNTKCKILNIEFTFIIKSSTLPSIRNMALNTKTVYELLKLNKSYLILKDSKDIFLTLKSLIIELDKKNKENDFLMQLLFLQIIINISILVDQRLGNFSMSNIHADKALSFINNNYYRDINISDIAANININKSYLQRIFKIHTGQTIVDYITTLRLDKAKMLLANTSIPIIDLSDYIGINSRQYFTFLFKKHFGKTPAQYRKSVNINSNL
jgi:AraC family transcriptional regulator, melibiose operon regulatory protein